MENLLDYWNKTKEGRFPDPLTGSEFAVLVFLKNKRIWKKSKVQLGDRINIERKTVSRAVKRLCELGIIKEETPPNRKDKRYPWIVYTKGAIKNA